MKKATVADVALRAGVSAGSVSRVLTGKNWVSEKLRRQVEEAARELNYSPNSLAQSLKAQRTMTIGAMVSDMANPLHATFLGAVQQELEREGYFLLVANTHNEPDRDRALLELFGRGRVDGVIAALADESHAGMLAALDALSVPVVFHDRETGGRGDSIGPDHRGGTLEATRYLLSLGHRRIALMTPSAAIRPGRERLAGYRAALQEAGLPFDPGIVSTLDASGGERAFSDTKAMLSKDHRPTAIICLGTRQIAGVISAIQALGLRVPHDVSLIGIGDTELMRLSTPPITALRWDIAQCGRWAAKTMLERLRDPDTARAARSLEVPTEMILRRSCASPQSLARTDPV